MAIGAPQAILFDWDNTLVSSWGAIHLALKATFEAMGQEPWTLQEVRQRVRASARDAFPQLFGERAGEATTVFYEAYEASHLNGLTLMPGAEALVRELAARGLYLGVVSNKTNYLLKAEVAHLGWQDHFGAVVGALDAERDKPAADPVHLALAPSEIVASQDVWLVGDTDIDMQTAAAAGCRPILLRDFPPEGDEFGGFNPHLHLRGCGELLSLLLDQQRGLFARDFASEG